MALADYDLDGDVDAFMAGVDQAGVRLRTSAGAQLREYTVSSLLGSQHGDLLHFGLGVQSVAEVEVRWPDGQRTVLAQVEAGQELRLSS